MWSRRELIQTMGAGALALPAAAKPSKTLFRAYVGTYTRGESKGIYSYILDTAAGTLKPEGLVAEVENPSFLALHPSGNYVYSCGELNKFNNEASGCLTAFKVDPKTGKLEKLNDAATGGTGTCHANVTRNGKFIAAANYGSGSCVAYGLEADGRLAKRTGFQQHAGSSVDKGRQGGPHAHSVNFDPSNRFLIVADLGLDQVKIYKFDPNSGSLEPNTPPFTKVAPGSGPRHFSFHPSGKYAYVINEMLCTITAFRWDGKKGTLTEIETVTTLPEPVKRGYSTAEVVCHPSGKFIYGSNRGHNTLAAFQIDGATGKLKLVEHESTQGEIPRNFAIDPTGQFLIAANQNSHTIVLFKIDQSTGALTPAGSPVKAPSPVCVRYMPVQA